MKHKYIKIFLGVFAVVALVGTLIYTNCNREEIPQDKNQLVIYSSHPLDFISPLIEEFEIQTGIQVTVVSGGSGELLDQVEAEQDNPQADILWGGSLSTLMPQSYLFEEYQSVNEEEMQDEFKNKEGMLTRFSDVPSILMINEDLVGDIKIDGYEDLLNPKLKGKIAYCSPSVSSSAYEHLINILYAMGKGNPYQGWDYVEKFCGNLDHTLLKSSTEVYEKVENGEFVVGLTFEEAAAKLVLEHKNIKIVYMEEGVISTPDCVCIIKNATHMETAKSFIDFVTGYGAQTVLTKQLNRRSVRKDVEVPQYLEGKGMIKTIQVNRDLVNEKKKIWIQRFKEIFYIDNEEGL